MRAVEGQALEVELGTGAQGSLAGCEGFVGRMTERLNARRAMVEYTARNGKGEPWISS